jgi:hypothetical protein
VTCVLVAFWLLVLVACVVALLEARGIAASIWPVQGGAPPGKEVKEMQRALLVTMLVGCTGCAADQSPVPLGPDAGPPGSRAPGSPASGEDASADLSPADASPLVDLSPADAVPPMPDLAQAEVAPSFPRCAAIGYLRDGADDCPAAARRTGDQRYSCSVCAGGPPPQACESSQAHPGDIPWLCVRSCADCQGIVKCTGLNMCTIVRLDDGGVL